MIENKNESIDAIMSNHANLILDKTASENPANRFSTTSPLLTNSENTLFSRSNYVFGEEKSKTIEKLEEELVSEKRSTHSANERYEIEKKEKIVIQKKYAKLEKKYEQSSQELDLSKYALDISEHVKRNLLHQLDNLVLSTN